MIGVVELNINESKDMMKILFFNLGNYILAHIQINGNEVV